jgi:hypothetical protein
MTAIARPARRRARAVLAASAVLLIAGISTLLAGPAAAGAPVGYVRLAHLSPDTPEVDVYLSKIGDSSFKEQVFTHVGYGVMSKYMALPVGTYAVAMRQQGAPASSQPVLTTQVTVKAGGAYTVAGVGKFAGLGLEIYTDDLTRPASGKAKVRVIQASVAAPVLDVALANGAPIASAVAFASTTSYQLVTPGTWSLRLTPNGSGSTSTVSCVLAPGTVYSLLILDGDNGLKVELRADARGGGSVPDGGVETGAGGAAPPTNPLVIVGSGLLAAIIVLAVALRMRRLAGRRA